MNPICFHRENIPSSLITTSEKADIVLLGACKAIESAVKKGLEGGLVDQYYEIDDNKGFGKSANGLWLLAVKTTPQ